MSDEVKELLLSLINQPNTKSRNRKIIFWYDPSKEYTDSIDDLITSDNIELIKYKENSFWIRYHIEKEVPDKDIIIYFDSERKKGVENPLLDLETSNSDFIFNPDKTTMLLSELNLDNDMYDIVKNNEKFFFLFKIFCKIELSLSARHNNCANNLYALLNKVIKISFSVDEMWLRHWMYKLIKNVNIFSYVNILYSKI